MKKTDEIGFILQGIKTEQFAVLAENYNQKKEMGLGTEVQFKLDQTNKHIGVFIGFEFIQNKKVFIKILVSCHFKIKDESWDKFNNIKKNNLNVPKGFLAHIAMITIGTTRGVLFAKTENTSFSKFIIPTLNVYDMINEDASFALNKE